MIRQLSTPFLLLLPIACASPTAIFPDASELRNGEAVAGVALSVADAIYSHGDEVSVHLINGSTGVIGYNSCTSARERLSDGVWVRIEPLRICTAAIYPLPAGERAAFAEAITSEWEPGRYRIVLPVHIPFDAAPRYVATPAFDLSD